MMWDQIIDSVYKNLKAECDKCKDEATKHSISYAENVLQFFFAYKKNSSKHNELRSIKSTAYDSIIFGFSFFVSSHFEYVYDRSYLSSLSKQYVEAINQARAHLCFVSVYVTNYENDILRLLGNEKHTSVVFDDLYVFYLHNDVLMCKIKHKNINKLCHVSSTKLRLCICIGENEQYSYHVTLKDNPFAKFTSN